MEGQKTTTVNAKRLSLTPVMCKRQMKKITMEKKKKS